MTTIMIGKALATVTENETLTSGMINAKIKFEFSADWHSGISRTAIFTAGDVTKVVLDSYWENNVCSIPQECLEKSDEILMVGVYGADNANTVAIPTVWATVGKIRKGYEGYEDVSTGTLPIWAQVQSAAAQSAQAAKDAQTAAETAQGKAETAQAAAETAQAAAETAQGKAETAQSKAEAARDASKAAQAAAQTAQGKAETAQSKAEDAQGAAEASATAAAEYESGAKSAAATATAGGNMAKSWAVGGTGTREGEDTDNAKYWAKAAQGAAGGGVTSFNGRSGAVAPKSGDYTAAMVGADASGAAAAVQGNLATHVADTTKHITETERTEWNAKQNALTFDGAPTSGSANPITSGAVYDALENLPEPIIGNAPPTASTVGSVGQQYIDKTNKRVWYCTAAEATGYTWILTSAGLSTKVNTTLSASGWSTAKKYTLSNSNITATSAVELLPRENNGITQAQMEALSGAMIVGGTQAAGSIQLVALGDVPTIDIPVTIIVRRDL